MAYSFLRKHKDRISAVRSNLIENERTTLLTLNETESSIKLLMDRKFANRFSPDRVINYDETRMSYDNGIFFIRRIESKCKDLKTMYGDKKQTLARLLPFISADGKAFMSVYIFLVKFNHVGEVLVYVPVEKEFNTRTKDQTTFILPQ